MKVLVCFGTRPEAIKMAPVIYALKQQDVEYRVCVTAQHREMLDQVMEFFKIEPDYDLDLMKPGQDLNILSSDIFKSIHEILLKENPKIVLVQGDTTTAFIIAMAAFNSGIKVGHIEAGLRTYNTESPFPEEANRQMISRIADFHFIPTKKSGDNLLKEMISEDKIFFTGNTVVDSLEFGKKLLQSGYKSEEIRELELKLISGKKVILVTGHRRENFEHGLSEICEALLEIAKREDVQIVFPVHPNPKVKDIVYEKLNHIANIDLIEPVSYPTILWLLMKCNFIISDSGGIQEEAPSFNKVVLVTREETERMEAVDAGFCILTGSSKDKILDESIQLLSDTGNEPTPTNNPFGDGKASERIVEVLLIEFKVSS
ncbi:non-hydrolyzing UDP-N-acetylglucosamine 2-epimerase [Christiangramia sp. ASW11-125]|uniref:non-hydrolyzing UDP-N-acetylglucosamine 2-epimerase n=1 Tax=Christiangramia sp. ASW11-125 TaxID=3400701 RepID=UPI003AAAA269